MRTMLQEGEDTTLGDHRSRRYQRKGQEKMADRSVGRQVAKHATHGEAGGYKWAAMTYIIFYAWRVLWDANHGGEGKVISESVVEGINSDSLEQPSCVPVSDRRGFHSVDDAWTVHVLHVRNEQKLVYDLAGSDGRWNCWLSDGNYTGL